MRSITAVLATATLALALTACGASHGENPGARAADASRPTKTATAPANQKFGDTYTWADGLAITVSVPTAFAPVDSHLVPLDASTLEPGTGFFKFNVTLANGTAAEYNSWDLVASAQSRSRECGTATDGVGFNETLGNLPAHTQVVLPRGFIGVDPADVVVEIDPGGDRTPVVFTN